MAIINAELDAMDQELTKGISQEVSQYALKYEVGKISDEF